MNPTAASVDLAYQRLYAAGWSVGETAAAGFWLAVGYNGENVIAARGVTQAEAWENACQQVQSVGMLGLSFY